MNFFPILTHISNIIITEVGRNSSFAYLISLLLIISGTGSIFILHRFIMNKSISWAIKQKLLGKLDRKLITNTIHNLLSLFSIAPIYFAFSYINFSEYIEHIENMALLIISTIAFIKFLSSLANLLIDTLLRANSVRGGAKALAPIINTSVWALGLIFLLDNLGFQISSLIAGLGIMGIALGLASRAVLSDFFSYLVILLDKPFRIGDMITIGKINGKIEYIGVKSTRIRTATGEITIFPNSELTEHSIENVCATQYYQKTFVFGVIYATPHKKLCEVKNLINKAASYIEYIKIIRSNFAGFKETCLEFEVTFEVLNKNEHNILQIQDIFALKIIEILEQNNIIIGPRE